MAMAARKRSAPRISCGVMSLEVHFDSSSKNAPPQRMPESTSGKRHAPPPSNAGMMSPATAALSIIPAAKERSKPSPNRRAAPRKRYPAAAPAMVEPPTARAVSSTMRNIMNAPLLFTMLILWPWGERGEKTGTSHARPSFLCCKLYFSWMMSSVTSGRE